VTIYEDAIQLLLGQPETARWPDLQTALERAARRRPVAWDFPILACQAVGGREELALIPVAAITCAHMAIMLIDDLLDEDPRGVYHQLGTGRTANLAMGLNGLGIRLLAEAKDCAHPDKAAGVLSGMVHITAVGQALDVRNIHTEEAYWEAAHTKSSPYFATALFLGALFGNAPLALAEELYQFGEIFGEIMQIHDDLNDSLAVPANVDWLTGRAPLPLLYAEIVDHPRRGEFAALRAQAADSAALARAQTILVECGAISYCVNELMFRKAKADQKLKTLGLRKPEAIQSLLDHTIAPVKHLFEAVGAEFED
jgi:geranylgeranyl diphosphate synthase type I